VALADLDVFRERLASSSLVMTAPPVPLGVGHGPWAFSLDIAAADGWTLPEPWDRPLAVRLAPDPVKLDQEATVLSFCAANDHGGPEVVALVPVGVPDWQDGEAKLWALVTTLPSDTPLGDLISFNLESANDLLEGFAVHHAALHSLPINWLRRSRVIPQLSLDTELARFDPDAHASELAWLHKHRPEPGEPVLCHGGYQPLAVFGPGSEQWDAYGGPGHGLSVTNWCASVLAEPEYDVAYTLVAFWSMAAYGSSRGERTALKMIRHTLSTTYRIAYFANNDLDAGRLRFWQAFHTLRGVARVSGTYHGDGSPYVAQDLGGLPDELGPELQRLLRKLVRV
jgi:hypothetical protein